MILKKLFCFVFPLVPVFLCAQTPKPFPKPNIIPHAQWHKIPPGGFPAEGCRRNIEPGEKIQFQNLIIELIAMTPAPAEDKNAKDVVKIKIAIGEKSEEKTLSEGAAFNWEGFHVAIIAAHTKMGELGEGLTEFEITTIASIPPEAAAMTIAGDAKSRARIKHNINAITLHHAGDPKPVTPEDSPIKKLQGLQSFSMNDRVWWDVPYHFLIALDGTIYEGRDYHYAGDTNTKYNPEGHFLIEVMGNYELQEANEAQIKSITDLMAWAVQEYNLPLDKIYGHKDHAQTVCPGKNLYKYLKDGTFQRGIEMRLGK